MARGYQKAIDKLLRENDCTLVEGGKGSHAKWYSPITDQTFTVPHRRLNRHTANQVMKDAGIKHKF